MNDTYCRNLPLRVARDVRPQRRALGGGGGRPSYWQTGVGKSAVATLLTRSFAARGHCVLTIDLDH
jgi:RimJ/RimL family protein N-acetyltransferase